MHGVTGRQDANDFLGVTIDDGNLACIAQRDREEVVDVAAVLRVDGRCSGGTITFQVAFISSMPNSGGAGGSCNKYRDNTSIC